MNKEILNKGILKVQNLNKSFPEGNGQYLKVLKSVNFYVSNGEIMLIMGPSGSGKTTLLSIIGCLMSATSGNVYINNIDTGSLSQNKLTKFRLSNIGFIFQSFKLLNPLKVIDNVSLVLKLSGVNGSYAKQKSYKILEEVEISHKANCYPDKLSNGEKQRVSIARALVSNPNLILADEPTGSLDSCSGQNIIDILRRLSKKHNKTVVVVSHDERIKTYADRLFGIEDGILIEF